MHCLKTAGELLHRSFNRESVLFERFAVVSAACVSCKLQVRSCQSCDIRREEYQRERAEVATAKCSRVLKSLHCVSYLVINVEC